MRGFREKIVYVHNPHPKVSDESLLKAAKLDLFEPKGQDPFHVVWKYASGLEAESVPMPSGSFTAMRESEAKDLLTSMRSAGIVIVEDSKDVAEVRKAALAGLRISLQFFTDRGARQAKKLMRERQPPVTHPDEQHELRHDYWPYWYNQAKADAIAAEIKRLTALKPPAKAEEKAA